MQIGDNVTSFPDEHRIKSSLLCTNGEIAVLVITSIILIFGFIGNLVTASKVIIEKKLHRPVPVCISCLAIADLLTLCFQYIRVPLSHCRVDISISTRETLMTITAVVVHSSAMHIILLALVRYGLIVHPFTMKYCLTSGKVVIASLLSWLLSLVIGLVYGWYNRQYYKGHVDENTDSIVQLAIALYILIVPICFFVSLYVAEMNVMRKSLLPEKSFYIKKISKMISLIMVSYIAFLAPYVIADSLRLLYMKKILSMDKGRFETMKNVMFNLARVFILLNYSINPFVYFLFIR
ncbi:C-C chemokine receptor type 5-like [Saccostrea echinata]|uniref:C-C chemokine receptor type 5-like n=1 Tax=Saccostrea echinata TaxID=191078 RepID=UPI002A8111DD|nr:C-C chemokine receptor type 5-like [Saccostrea echinata]